MKKTIFFICALLQFVLCAAAARAEIAAYYQDKDVVYTYTKTPNQYTVPPTADIMNGDGAHQYPEKVSAVKDSSETTVRYVFVIEESETMNKHSQDIYDLVNAIVKDNEAKNTVYNLATFGTQFRFVDTDYTNTKKFLDKVDSIRYIYDNSNVYSAITKSIDKINKNFPKNKNEFVNIVLIYSDIDTDTTNPDPEAVTFDDLYKKLNKSSNVALHTYGFEIRKSATDMLFQAKPGLDYKNTDKVSASDAGGKIADYVNNCYAVSTSFGNITEKANFDITITFKDPLNKIDPLTVTGPIIYSPDDSRPRFQSPAPPVETTTDTPSDEPTTSETTEDTTEAAIPGEDIEGSTQTDFSISDILPDQDESVTATEPNNEKKPFPVWLLIIPAIIAAVIIIALIAAVSAKNSQKAFYLNKHAKKENALFLRIEATAGTCLNPKNEYYLADQLTIGTDENCDVVLAGSGIAPQHARIFISSNAIMLEDCGTPGGTYLAGMRLHAPSRLRSGDEIFIAGTKLIVKF